MKTRFILIDTSHAGNVGAAARALKVMGFDDLVLVNPRWPDVLTREETVQRASGATDVLARARIVATLDEALEGVSHLCATAMTPRDFGPPTEAPRPHLEALAARWRAGLAAPVPPGEAPAAAPLPAGVAFLFGSERFGMANADVYRCHVALSIPTAPGYGSLNLAAAVQLVAYEWRQALGGFGPPHEGFGGFGPSHEGLGGFGPSHEGLGGFGPASGAETALEASVAPRAADAASVAGLLAHWEQALVEVGFLDPAAPKKLMPRLNQLFNRAGLTPEEIHILRGVAKAMQQAVAAGASAAAPGRKA